MREVLVENGRATGVVLDSGETLRAPRVVSNIHPKLLFEKLVDPTLLPDGFQASASRAIAPGPAPSG